MSPGAIVWSGIAGLVAAWFVASALAASVPTPARIGRRFVASWLGRLVLAAGWAEVGWHLFCQRP